MTLADLITTHPSFASAPPALLRVTLAPHNGPRPGGNARQRRTRRRWLSRVGIVYENATITISNLTDETITVTMTGREAPPMEYDHG